MGLSKFFVFILLVALSYSAGASLELPLFITKQDIQNIRFISYDGGLTYYQRSNGSLQLSTNYNVREVLKFNEKSQFLVFVSPLKKYTVISHQKEPYSMASSRWMNNLYISDYGKTKTNIISEGIFISFHGDQDQFFTYYVPTEKKIFFANSNNPSKKTSISIIAGLNPYYLPKTALIDNNRLLFTDQNRKGVSALRIFNFKSKKSQLFYKLQDSTGKLDICSHKKSLYLWESSYNSLMPGTRITQIPLDKFSRDNQKFIYQSKLNDTGNLICNKNENEIFFIKKYKKDGVYFDDVAKHDIINFKTKLISNLRYTTSIVNLDGRLLIPFQGKYYSLDKKSDMSKIDQLKKVSE